MVDYDFCTIDFETANCYKDSACQIGITKVSNNEIKEVRTWLINPETWFDYFNIKIHGITEEKVKDKPTFKDVWPEVLPYLQRMIFAHNARFDIAVLLSMLDKYQIEIPSGLYGCSLAMSRRTWYNEPSYSLENLCNKFDILPGKHDAGEDSRACAELVIRILQEKQSTLAVDDLSIVFLTDLEKELDIEFGIFSPDGYTSSVCKRLSKTKKLYLIVPDVTKIDTDHIFYKKNVVFTGTLSSMVRKDAQQIIANIGGENQDTITQSTDFLIVGQQDYRVVGESGMSSKQKKAFSLKEKGSAIEILSEKEFIEFL
jgi:DNA polymerase-3 subunit epsilon